MLEKLKKKQNFMKFPKIAKEFFSILFFLLVCFCPFIVAQENNNQHNKDFLFRYYMKMGDRFYQHHDFQNNLQLALKYYILIKSISHL